MKVWARYAVPVMVLVDEAQDTIERIVMVPGERFIDRETMGDMLVGFRRRLHRCQKTPDDRAANPGPRKGDHAVWEVPCRGAGMRVFG